MSDREAAPLLQSILHGRQHHHHHQDANASPPPEPDLELELERPRPKTRWDRWRESARGVLESKQKHYVILAMVALDVAAILTDILVSLVTCDMGTEAEPWVGRVQEGTVVCGLVFSCLFLAELAVTVWAFGLEFFSNWFHVFDALVIVISFGVDVLARGIVEQIASLVVVLRLWRLVKIVEELSVGASERMEEMEARLSLLEREKAELVGRLVARGLEA